MMNKKRVTAIITTGIMAVSALMPMGVFAADQSADTPVMYSAYSNIPDPENPTNPKWGVQIPTTIQFTNKAIVQSADVEMVGMNGGVLDGTMRANVTVTSAKNYTFGVDNGAYELKYAGTTMTGADAAVGTLNGATAKKITGTATLTVEAKKAGNYTDTLTYKVTTTP